MSERTPVIHNSLCIRTLAIGPWENQPSVAWQENHSQGHKVETKDHHPPCTSLPALIGTYTMYFRGWNFMRRIRCRLAVFDINELRA